MGALKTVNRGASVLDRERRFDTKSFLPRLWGRMKVGGFVVASLVLMGGSPLSYAEKPERIVSMNLCSDELVVRLAEPRRIAALTYFAADPSVSNVSEEAKQFHLIRSQAEEVMSLKPDLILAGVFTDRASIALLKRMGYPLRLIELPRDFEGIRKNIRTVAEVLGESEKGELLITGMNQTLQALKMPLGRAPRVLFYQRGGYTPGAETFEDALIQMAGAKNISTEKGIQHYGVLALEDLIEARPDYVIFSEFDKMKRSVGGWLLDHPALKQSQKIQTVTIPGRWLNCGGPLSAQAVLELRTAFSKKGEK